MESQCERSGLWTSYWRKEILQFLLWMHGEGFGEHFDAALLERAFGIESRAAARHLDELAEVGLLSRDGDDLYRLTEAGQRYGSRLIDAELIEPDLGDCGLDRRDGPRRVARVRGWCGRDLEEMDGAWLDL